MKKLLMGIFLTALATRMCFATYTSQINLSPTTAVVEQKVGSSLTLSQTGGSSLIATYINDFMPQVWVTGTGSSVTSFAVSKPSFGSSLAGQTNLFGGSLTLPMSWIFHAPSIYPHAGNSVQTLGTQTYSVGAQISLSDGTVIYPTAGTITVNPMFLPSSEMSGWN